MILNFVLTLAFQLMEEYTMSNEEIIWGIYLLLFISVIVMGMVETLKRRKDW